MLVLLGVALLALMTARCNCGLESCSDAGATRCHEGVAEVCDSVGWIWVPQDCSHDGACHPGVCGQDGRCRC